MQEISHCGSQALVLMSATWLISASSAGVNMNSTSVPNAAISMGEANVSSGEAASNTPINV